MNETKLVLCHIVTCLNSEGQSRALDNKLGLKVQTLHIDNMIATACTKTRNNRNETTGTKQPERPEQEPEMTGTTETKIEHDWNNVVEHDRNDSET